MIEKVTVDIDAIGLAEVFGYQAPDSGQVLFLQTVIILNILQIWRKLCYPFSHCHLLGGEVASTSVVGR